MADDLRDRNDPELKYLSVERNSFNDPATQAEWTQKRLVWVPHETQALTFGVRVRVSMPRLKKKKQ
ncbi:myosin heavy chain [Culex quinquefasciatus]|uniref:Myosin heavy chain n=1 Tax=Culex quinquefasciatus TaxID=7176 RepID=B0X908_CULQU|nr:myosin heavy chain [Culex quinquefasciatus]|eukprot:XP_001866130.1 myosin heavy chain [Culex quinquefasciatus]